MEKTDEPNYQPLKDHRALIIAGKHDSHIPPSTAHHLAKSLRGTTADHVKDDLHHFLHGGLENLHEHKWERETKVVEVDAGSVTLLCLVLEVLLLIFSMIF